MSHRKESPKCSPAQNALPGSKPINIHLLPQSLTDPQLSKLKVSTCPQACSLPAHSVWHGAASCQSPNLGVFSKSSFLRDPSHPFSYLSHGLALLSIPCHSSSVLGLTSCDMCCSGPLTTSDSVQPFTNPSRPPLPSGEHNLIDHT